MSTDSKKVKNIIFDLGNVLVRWAPLVFLTELVGSKKKVFYYYETILKSQDWLLWSTGNPGEDDELFEKLNQHEGLIDLDIEEVFRLIKHPQFPIKLIQDMIPVFYKRQLDMYILSDSSFEILSYLKRRYDFWKYIKGFLISAKVGSLKASYEPFLEITKRYNLHPGLTLFIDDHDPNITVAKQLGFQTVLYDNSFECVKGIYETVFCPPLRFNLKGELKS